MAKTNRQITVDPVMTYYKELKHPMTAIVEGLRKIILETDPLIAEQIKWNSPAFYYTGEMKPFDPKEYKRDLVVFNLHRKDRVLLVFPTGARVNDDAGILEGNYTDGRRTAIFKSLTDVKNKASALRKVIRLWLDTIEK